MLKIAILVCLTVLLSLHPLLWVYNSGNLLESIQLGQQLELITCCCEPGECFCEGHESCNTVVSECYDLGKKDLFPVAHEETLINELKKVIIAKKRKIKKLSGSSLLNTSYINKSKIFIFADEIFHPPKFNS